MKLGIVILAAGQGTRMKSDLPKVLHPLAGRPLLAHVLDAARSLQPDSIAVVYGHGGDRVRESFAELDLQWIEQRQRLGTGHAVQQAMPLMQGMDKVLVLYGDVPLIRPESLQALIESATSGLGLMTVTLKNPKGYGRIERDASAKVLRIVEQKDANPQQLAICEINTGIMLVERAQLQRWLQALSPKNVQGEYYLTDIIAMAVHEGVEICVTQPDEAVEEHTRQLLQEAAPGDRLIIGITEDIPAHRWRGSLLAISRAIDRYGRLPIHG